MHILLVRSNDVPVGQVTINIWAQKHWHYIIPIDFTPQSPTYKWFFFKYLLPHPRPPPPKKKKKFSYRSVICTVAEKNKIQDISFLGCFLLLLLFVSLKKILISDCCARFTKQVQMLPNGRMSPNGSQLSPNFTATYYIWRASQAWKLKQNKTKNDENTHFHADKTCSKTTEKLSSTLSRILIT